MATTERLFIVCDRCGRVWDTGRADYEPEVCIVCGDGYRAWIDAVHGLRRTGYTDGQIGEALGVTKQAIQQVYGRDHKKAP